MTTVRMEYALNADGNLARASTALRAKGIGFQCLDCGERLKLRRGDVRAAHFSHLTDSNCTGEGVIHHAAKLELARALRERERPLLLRVPCHWPGCTKHLDVNLDRMLGAFTTVRTEHTYTFMDGTWVRFDVAVLLHDSFEAGFEVYHHHRVPEEKRRGPMPNWLEISAVPLLENPYVLTLLKDDPPINPLFEAALQDPLTLREVSSEFLETVSGYRGHGSGQWVYEIREDDVHIDDFSWYACDDHRGQYDQLIEVALSLLPKREVAPPVTSTLAPENFTNAVDRVASAARFAVKYYAQQGVLLTHLKGLSLKACRCPHCDEPVVVIKDEFVPQLRQFQGLLSAYKMKAINHCGFCRQIINRRILGDAIGVHVPGDVVAAWTR